MIASISEGLRATVEKMGAKLVAPIEGCQNYINVNNGEVKPPF